MATCHELVLLRHNQPSGRRSDTALVTDYVLFVTRQWRSVSDLAFTRVVLVMTLVASDISVITPSSTFGMGDAIVKLIFCPLYSYNIAEELHLLPERRVSMAGSCVPRAF